MSTLKNKVTLIGNAGMAPEIKNLDNKRKVAKFSLATQESYKNAQGEWVNNSTWHNIVAWGPTASFLEKHVSKGQEIMVEGKIVNRSYEVDGTKKYITEIEVNEVMLLGKKSNN